MRLILGLSVALTFTCIVFSIKFHQSENLPKKETYLQVYFLAGVALFNLQMGLSFHEYKMAKAEYQTAACDLCFESIEPFAEKVETTFMLRCDRVRLHSKKKRSISHRRKHPTIAPVSPEKRYHF